MSLLEFSNKHDVPALKAKVEPVLIKEISAANVCRLTNCSILAESPKLKEKCIKFLMDAFVSKTPLSDIKNLDKFVAMTVFCDSFYQIVQTRQ
uniref:Uncharacterized protein n=1 Tax=Panagrolaimus davidi TaxID=227884 RepID=A0A914QIY6_9BILA